MLELEKNMVAMNSTVKTKEDAILEVGKLLVDGGYIEIGYIDSLFGREAVSNTYLGNGICIPHGLQENRNLILKTGIAVLQVPNGVEWKDGEKAHIIVGIAAKSDEHIQILSQLTNLITNEEEAKKLAVTTDIDLILNTLNTTEKKESNKKIERFDKRAELVFPGCVGFHARPASLFVDLSNKFDCEVQLEFDGKSANGKSVASILKLGITGKSTFIVSTKGSDEDKALEALTKLVNSGMGEELEEEIETTISKRAYQGLLIEGIPAAPGMAIGPVVVLNEDSIEINKEGSSAHEERKKLREALDKAALDLNKWLQSKHEKVDKNRMDIFIAHLALIKDPELQNKALNSIVDGVSAEYTWWQIITSEMKSLSLLNDLRLSQRANDIKDIGKRVLKYLDENAVKSSEMNLKEPSILVSLDMTPSETSKLDKEKVLALVTAKGGSTSHTAILARSMGIPSIAGAGEDVLNISSRKAIADGDSGILVIEPSDSDLELAQKIQNEEQIKKDKEFEARFYPAVTTDGHRMEIVANIANAKAALEAVNNGAEGVGLLRTEFLFLERHSAPNETEQFQAYKKMVQHLNGLPLIVRTLDIGGDKEVSYLNLPKEDNPFLGIRGIRLCLEYKELFKEQLRAIYQASKYGPIKIMFPMIGLLEEFREASKIAEEVRLEVGALKIDIGMMIEVPSAVLMAEHFIKEADFFSIGTNDLTQYVLSMDRGHQGLARKADALHPAILKMIKMTCDAAKKEGKWVGVCGNLAANPLAAKILTGLGVRELSVTSTSVANIKSIIRATSFSECEDLASKALTKLTSDEVRDLENL